MFFALVTLGVCFSVDVSLSQKLFIVIVLIILGLKIFDAILKKLFSFNLFNYSFGDGNVTFSLEIETSEDIKQLNSHKGLISSFRPEKQNLSL